MSELTSPFLRSAPSAQIQNASLYKIAQSYLEYYAAGRGHTARAKRLDIARFLAFLASLKGVGKVEKLVVNDWDFSSVQRFVEDSLTEGEAPTTVLRRLATLKHMGRTLAEKVAGFINPAREVKGPKIAVGKPKGLTAHEIAVVKLKAESKYSEKSSFIRLRNKFLFDFLLDTGIRADEVRLLKLGQLDEKIEWIKNVRTKGKRYRNVYLTSEIKTPLKAYLEERQKVLKKFYAKLTRVHDRSLPLFISTYNAVPGDLESFMMGTKTVWRAINEFSAGTPLHPHLLRHSYALDLLDSSGDVRLVAQALGHSDVRITMRYTERRDEEVATALEKSRKRKKR